MKKNKNRWLGWAFAQALSQTAGQIPRKKVALIGPTGIHALLVMFVIGIIQTVTGLGMAYTTHASLVLKKDFAGAAIFALGAFLSSMLGIAAFQQGGDIGVVSFIVTMSIIPGTIIDALFFGHHMKRSGWLGILIFLFAGYSILNWPSTEELLRLPSWVWYALGIPVSNAIIEGVTQRFKTMNPWFKNFWGGLVTIACCLIALPFMSLQTTLHTITTVKSVFWLWSGLLGLCTVGIWLFNLISYRDGATIAFKKLVVSSTYLLLAMATGVVIFAEPLTRAKIVSLLLYPIAYFLVQRGTKEIATENRS